MTSKASTPIVDDFDSRDDNNEGIKKSDYHFENVEDYHGHEEEPCLPLSNGSTDFADANKLSVSNNSLAKKQSEFLNNEKDEKFYFPENNEYSVVKEPKKSKKKLSFAGKTGGGGSDDRSYEWSSFECEKKIRKKFGLTHCGFLTGLILVFATLLFLFVIIVLGLLWPQTLHSQQVPICIKSACLESSALVLPKLDRSQSPCDDFYSFACGGWSKKHSKPPPARSKWGPEEEMDARLSEMTREVISVLPHQTRSNSLTWKIKNFYESCMSLDNIETDNERPLKKIITELGGWNVLRNFQVLSWEFTKTFVKLHSEFGITPFFDVSVVTDPRNASKSILKISPSGLGLPDKSYYYREKDDRISSSYIRYMKDVARQLGATSNDANFFSEDMFYFERRIAEATPPAEELLDVRKQHIYKLTNLLTLAPSVPLEEILDAVFGKANGNDDPEILVSSPFYLHKISNIIATTDRSALNNYLIWNLVKEYLPYLSQNFQDIYSVYNRETTGASNLIERWEFCIKTLQKYMDFGLAAQLEKTTPEADRKKRVQNVKEIFEAIRKIVKESITRAQWIDLDLYKHLINKVVNASVQVGFSDTHLDSSYLEDFYSKFYVQKNNFFQNILYGVSFRQEEKRRRYINSKEEYKWLSLIASNSKVKYVPSENTIVVPQRLLYKPFYDPDYPLPLIYGTLGVQISHEMVSSLLKYSALYAANGSLVEDKSLVANLSLSSVNHQLNCLSDLCSGNDIVTKERANETSLSTFTTLSAIKQALKALRRVSENVEHVHQAGLEDFEDEGLFFIAYGQSLCAVLTAQEMDKENTTSTNLNVKQLLKVLRLQVKPLAETFNCALPSDPCKHIL